MRTRGPSMLISARLRRLDLGRLLPFCCPRNSHLRVCRRASGCDCRQKLAAAPGGQDVSLLLVEGDCLGESIRGADEVVVRAEHGGQAGRPVLRPSFGHRSRLAVIARPAAGTSRRRVLRGGRACDGRSSHGHGDGHDTMRRRELRQPDFRGAPASARRLAWGPTSVRPQAIRSHYPLWIWTFPPSSVPGSPES